MRMDKGQLKAVQQKLLNEIEVTQHKITEYTELCKPIAPENAIGRISRMDAINNKSVVEAALKNGYTTILLADHGNCEMMMNPDGSPNTAHTTNPVPVILIDENNGSINNGVLGDIAPTILDLMGIEKPKAMTQHSILIK